MRRLLPFAAIAVMGGFMLHIGIFYLIRIEVPVPRSVPEDPVSVDYLGDLGIRADPALRSQAVLRDSAPLFMPTRWNLVSQMGNVASLREATEVFAPYPPELTLPDSAPGSFPAEVDESRVRETLLSARPEFYLSRYGRQARESIATPDSSPSALAQPLAGKLASPVRLESLPEGLRERAPETLWAPFQIYLQLVNGMPSGRPVIAQSSGFSDWDEALQDFVGSLDFYHSLQSGYYRITVYP
jgi:hypothetical protein